MSTVRIVLRPGVTEDDLEDVALDVGWILIGSMAANDLTPYRTVWDDENDGTEVTYIWDDLVSMAYVYLRDGDVAAAEAVVRSRVGTFGLDDLLHDLAAAATGPSAVEAVCRIAVARPEPDAWILGHLRRLAHSPDGMVRIAVVTAIGYLEWGPLLELLREMRSADSDPAVRREAGIVLSGSRAGEQRTCDEEASPPS